MFNSTILIDNIADGELVSEWGFAVYIEYNDKKYLLDTGGSDKYLDNARKLGIDIADIDVAVLSHSHYDHSGGYKSFFEINKKAELLVADACCEECYVKFGPIRKRVGIPRGILGNERVHKVNGLYKIDDGVYIVPHLKNELEKLGKKAHMYRKVDDKIIPDDFSHEQSLVFETDKGLIVLNSCSHGGLNNILADVNHYLPGKKIYMTIGGLHLAGESNKNVKEVAKIIKSLDIEHVVTGHCTGNRAFNILKKELGDKVSQMHVGMKHTEMEIG